MKKRSRSYCAQRYGVYKRSGLTSSEFTVRTDQSGLCEIRFEGDRHHGSFAVPWNALEQQ